MRHEEADKVHPRATRSAKLMEEEPKESTKRIGTEVVQHVASTPHHTTAKRIRISDLLNEPEEAGHEQNFNHASHSHRIRRPSTVLPHSSPSKLVHGGQYTGRHYPSRYKAKGTLPADPIERHRAMRKIDHNEAERLRRQRLREGIEELRHILPKEYTHSTVNMVVDAASHEMDNLTYHIQELRREKAQLLGRL